MERITETFSNKEMSEKDALKKIKIIYNEVYEIAPKPISQYNEFIRAQMIILKENNSTLKGSEKMAHIGKLWKHTKENNLIL
jgi:uncharacterized protein YqgQ